MPVNSASGSGWFGSPWMNGAASAHAAQILRYIGVPDQAIHLMTVENPRRFFGGVA